MITAFFIIIFILLIIQEFILNKTNDSIKYALGKHGILRKCKPYFKEYYDGQIYFKTLEYYLNTPDTNNLVTNYLKNCSEPKTYAIACLTVINYLTEIHDYCDYDDLYLAYIKTLQISKAESRYLPSSDFTYALYRASMELKKKTDLDQYKRQIEYNIESHLNPQFYE